MNDLTMAEKQFIVTVMRWFLSAKFYKDGNTKKMAIEIIVKLDEGRTESE